MALLQDPDRAFLLGMLDACPLPMLAFDGRLRCTGGNRAAARALDAPAASLIGRSLADATPTGERASVDDAQRRALAGETLTLRAVRLTTAAGGERAWDLTVAPVRDAAETIIGVLVTLAEPAAGRAILDVLPHALLAYDTGLRVTEWNAATARGTGVAREAALGRSVLELFPYVCGTPIEEEYRRSLAGEIVDGRDRCWTPTGSETPRWYDVVYLPLRDAAGAVIGGMVVTSDVTARREAREDSTAEQRLLRTVIDSAPFGLLAFDRELTITEWNAEAERSTRMRRADVVRRPLLHVLPDLADTQILRDYHRALAGETVRVRSRWYERPGGEAGYYDVVFAPMHDGRGTVTGGVMIAIDVTEREVAERAQRTDRAFLRSLIDASPAAIIAFDQSLRQTEWNERAERNTGIRRADALGRTTEELFPGFEGSEWHRLVQRVLGGEVLRGLDYALVDSASGQPLILDVTMAPLYDASAAVSGALVMSLDVTERVRAQRALEESEARYRQLFEHSAAMQLVVDAETLRIVDANTPAVAFHGWPRAELIGMPFARLLPEAQRGDPAALLRRDGDGPVRRTHVTATGEAREVEAYATLITRGGQRFVHTAMHDITERVRAEAERDRLIRIVEATSDVVAIGDARTRTLRYVNRAGRKLFGVGRDTHDLPMREVVADVDMALAFEEALPAAVRDGVWRGDIRLRDRDGRIVPMSIVAVAHYDAAGAPAYLSAICRDISAEKRREAELAAARELAERTSRAKSAFLAGMSHELRTPLGAVLGFAQLLREDHAESLTERQREYLDDVLIGARQLHAVVDDALDLARIEAGVIDIRPQEVDLGALVDEALVTVAPLAAERGVTLERLVADDAARLVADPARVRQVLLNYLSNAVKFNRRGGRARVEVTAAPDERVRLTVRDTGRGIAPENLSRLFVEFQRLGAHDVAGSGLGLAITRRIVEAMGGTVAAESEPGAGSAFHAVLPRTPAPATTRAESTGGDARVGA